MAHLTNVTQVKKQLEPQNPQQTVIDPFCGKEIFQSRSRHMIFRADATFYFCSKECQQNYLQPAKKKSEAA